MDKRSALASASGILNLGGFEVTESQLESLLMNRGSLDNFFSPVEVAEKLGYCAQTVWNKIKNGELEAVNLGTARKPKYAIKESEVVRFLESCPTPAATGIGRSINGNND